MAKLSGKAREKLLLAQTEAGKREIKKITGQARKAVQLKIIAAVQSGDFVRAATVRDSLYRDITKEYIALNGGVDDWTKKRSKTVAKTWHALAIDDLPKAAMAITFGKFSEKYLNDIVGKINPSTVSKRVAMNARLEAMLSEDIRAIRTAVSETIRKGALTGMNYKEMAAEMQSRAAKIAPAFKFVDKGGRTWDSDSYFAMLNRTLHNNVARETYSSTVIEAGYDLVRIEGKSGDADSPCIPYEGEILSISGMSKKHKSLDAAMADGLFHPNCCVPDTVVESPDMIAASRFEYSGEVIEVKYASGNSLTVTPNHMLLTDQGFAAAHTLAKGDNVLRCAEGNRLRAGRPNVNRNPSTIKDVFMAFRESGCVSSAQMPVSAKHFHGDGKLGNGNVDVIATDRLLLNNVTGEFHSEPFSKRSFAFADSKLFHLASNSPLFFVLLSAGHATNRIVSLGSVGSPPFSPATLLSNPELFALAPDVYACGNKAASDKGAGHSKRLGNLIVSNAGLIEIDSVVNVNVRSFSGHVYDLQSLSTLYTANGYLSSNCIHTTSVVIEELTQEEKATLRKAGVGR
jgi:hypothetical protein